MKRYFLLILALGYLAIWTSCSKTAPTTSPITFESVTLRDSTGNCGEGDCFQVDVNYIKAKETNSIIAKAISDTIQKFTAADILGLMMESPTPSTVENALSAARSEFTKQSDAQKEATDPFPVRYSLDITTSEIHQNPKVVCIEQAIYSYAGGAHPNTDVRYLVFDKQTGKIFNMKNVVSDSASFMKIVEQYVRKAHEIPANQSLTDAGFLFGEEQNLPLPVDFAIKEKSLLIMYNAYEIAAYAMGPTALEIPLIELEKVLKLDLLK
jgi:Deacetylase PdaC/Protein of unknown function (DUF3298)